ncbi:MAG TPA: Ig-like domain-containing protein [Steroidobacteraceae bacterium]|nr:Ig-like domain-containing protein [Steroidobacteraceae bacterium]
MKGRTLGAFALALLFSHAVIAGGGSSERRIPTDSGGRPLVNDQGSKLTYTSDPTPLAAFAGSGTHTPAAIATAKSTKIKTRSKYLQKTGTSPSYDEVWSTTAWGSGIGVTGIWPVDANSDGKSEFVLAGGAGFGGGTRWSIVGYNTSTHNYDILWQSAGPATNGCCGGASITALRVVEHSGSKRVWVARGDGSIEVINLLTRTLIQTITTNSAVFDFAFADADNDGDTDVVAVSSDRITLYDPDSLATARTILYGGLRIAVGNVDDDPQLEIAIDSGKVLEVDGATTTVQWDSGASFGARVALGDIDGDGRDELVAAQGWYDIRAWDVELKSVKWSIHTALDIAAMRLIDVTGDSTPEIVYGDGQWGSIHAVRASDQVELWNIPNPEHGVTDIAIFDADGDGSREVVWGAGYTSTGPDYLYVHDLATRAFEWQNDDYSGPYQSADFGDVDHDGSLDMVVASFESQSGYADGLIEVHDASTYALKWRSSGNLFEGFAWTGVHNLRLANVDADPQLEILVATDRLYDGTLYVIDGLTHEVQSKTVYDSGSPLNVLDVADLDGDGKLEVIAGNTVAHTGSPGVFMYVIDPSNGSVVWKSAALAGGFSSVTDVLAADVGAAGQDVLAVSDAVHLVRWASKQQIASTTKGYVSVAAANVIGGPELDVVAGRSDGSIDVLDGDTLVVLATYAVCTSPSAQSITAIRNQGAGNLLLTCGNQLIVYNIASQSVVDSTSALSAGLGANASLAVATLNGRSIVLSSGDEAVLFADLSSNHVPVALALNASVHWRNATVALQASGSDADGDPLQYEFESLPTHGMVKWTDQSAGTFDYTSDGSSSTSDHFSYRVSDGSQFSAPQTIDISFANTQPYLPPNERTVHWKGMQQIAVVASDADSDPLTFALVSAPEHATAAIDATTGVLTLTPSTAYVGDDAVSYSVSDGVSTTTATLKLMFANATPVAASADVGITPGVDIQSRFSGTDSDGDSLSYSVVQNPTLGTLTFESDTGLYRYVPKQDGTGTDHVIFAVSDGVAEAQAQITFNYPAANPPVSSPTTSPPSSAPSSGGGHGGGGAMGVWLMGLLLCVLGARRARSSKRATIWHHA